MRYVQKFPISKELAEFYREAARLIRTGKILHMTPDPEAFPEDFVLIASEAKTALRLNQRVSPS
jgi:hypothetical protein